MRGPVARRDLGLSCTALLIAEKVMIDEIGREYLLGWEVTGEWIILYMFLTIQLSYNVAVITRLCRGDPAIRRRPAA